MMVVNLDACVSICSQFSSSGLLLTAEAYDGLQGRRSSSKRHQKKVERSSDLCTFVHSFPFQVTREASLKNIIITKSIFNAIIYPGVDIAFIFSIIIIMDKIYVHDD